MDNNTKLTLSVEDVCASTDSSRPTVMAFIHRSENPMPHIKAGRKYLIPRAALETWLIEEAARNAMSIGRPMVR